MDDETKQNEMSDTLMAELQWMNRAWARNKQEFARTIDNAVSLLGEQIELLNRMRALVEGVNLVTDKEQQALTDAVQSAK